MGGVDVLLGLLDYFNYEALEKLLSTGADKVIWISPFLILTIFLLELVNQADSAIVGKADLGEALRKVMWPVLLFLGYSFIGYNLITIVDSVHDIFMNVGSVKTAAAEYKDIVRSISGDNGEGELLDEGINLLSLGTKAIAYLLFISSFIVLIFMEVLLKFGITAFMVFLYLYGYIAIPTIRNELIGLEKGWTKSWLGLFVYAIVHGILYMAVTAILEAGGAHFKTDMAASENSAKAGAYFFFVVINGIMIAVEVASIWIAFTLASNQSAVMAGLAPFAAVGAAMGSAYNSAMKSGAGSLDSPVLNSVRSASEKALNQSMGDNARALSNMIPTFGADGNGGGGGTSSESGGGSLSEPMSDSLSTEDRGSSPSMESQPSSTLDETQSSEINWPNDNGSMSELAEDYYQGYYNGEETNGK